MQGVPIRLLSYSGGHNKLLGFLDDEDIMFEGFLVEGEFTRLSEGQRTPRIIASEGFFILVNVHVLL